MYGVCVYLFKRVCAYITFVWGAAIALKRVSLVKWAKNRVLLLVLVKYIEIESINVQHISIDLMF